MLPVIWFNLGNWRSVVKTGRDWYGYSGYDKQFGLKHAHDWTKYHDVSPRDVYLIVVVK